MSKGKAKIIRRVVKISWCWLKSTCIYCKWVLVNMNLLSWLQWLMILLYPGSDFCLCDILLFITVNTIIWFYYLMWFYLHFDFLIYILIFWFCYLIWFYLHHCKHIWFDFIVALSFFHSKIGLGLFFNSISFSTFVDIFKSPLSMFTLLWCSNLLDWNCLSGHCRLFWFT